MTALDLDAIKARAEKATEGPWENISIDSRPNWILGRARTPDGGWYGTEDVLCIQDENLDGSYMGEDDLNFIAAARTDVPALVAEVERLQGIWDRVEAWTRHEGPQDAISIITEIRGELFGGDDSESAELRSSDSSSTGGEPWPPATTA